MVQIRSAVIQATVPSANGTVDYTDSKITTWSTKGIAFIWCISDTAALTAGGFMSYGGCDSSGNQGCAAIDSIDALTTTPENKDGFVNDHVAVILDGTVGTGFASTIRCQFSAALANGVRLNWVDTAGVGSKVIKLILVLVDGLTNTKLVTDGFTAAPGFNSSAVFHMARDTAGSPGAWPPTARSGQAISPGLGAALNTGGLPQKSLYCVSDRLTDPLVSRGGRRTADFASGSSGAAESTGRITAFNATNVAITGGASGVDFAMLSPNGSSDFAFALESLDGTTGTKSFTGLGMACETIIGFICGVTTDDTFEADSANLATFSFFVTDGATTVSFGIAQRHTGTAINAGNPTDTYSVYANGSISVVDHINAADFAATVTALTATGLTLNVTNGYSGSMFLLGFKSANLLSALSETEEISDNIVAFLNRSLALSETVEISDGLALFTTDVTDTEGEAGTSFSAHADRGESFSAGAEAGTAV